MRDVVEHDRLGERLEMSGTVRTVEVANDQERVLPGQVLADGFELLRLVVAAKAEVQVCD